MKKVKLGKRRAFIGGITAVVLGILTMTPVSAAEMKIPDNAKQWGGHSYRLYKKARTFEDAEAYCERLGGHLAVISSAAENKMLTNYLIKKSCSGAMIGLYDENGSDGTWDTWVTGEKVKYKNWGRNQPDWTGQKIAVLCSEANSYYGWEAGEWDNGWDGDYCFICEWDGNGAALKSGDTAETKLGRYQVIDAKKKTAKLTAVKDKGAVTLTVPATVEINGEICKVVEVGRAVMKGNTSLTKVVLGKNVVAVGKNAFYGCKNLKKVQLKGKSLETLKNGSFKQTSAKLKFTANKLTAAEKVKLQKKVRKAGNRKAVVK